MCGQRLNDHVINSLKKVHFSWNICSWLYRKHLSSTAAPLQKNSKSYDNRPEETSSNANLHPEPRDYQINYVNNIIDQRNQYGVFVERPTSLPRSVLSGEEEERRLCRN